MKILVDTSVLRAVRPLEKLIVAAADQERGHRVLVPTLVWAERDFQVRRALAEKGSDYDGDVVRQFYARHEPTLELLPLSIAEAEGLAGRLMTRFPSGHSWSEAKKYAHVDWYLAAMASPDRPMVTLDDGPEWKGWPEGSVLSVEAAVRLLEVSP